MWLLRCVATLVEGDKDHCSNDYNMCGDDDTDDYDGAMRRRVMLAMTTQRRGRRRPAVEATLRGSAKGNADDRQTAKMTII
jgi:hypothetical protein